MSVAQHVGGVEVDLHVAALQVVERATQQVRSLLANLKANRDPVGLRERRGLAEGVKGLVCQTSALPCALHADLWLVAEPR